MTEKTALFGNRSQFSILYRMRRNSRAEVSSNLSLVEFSCNALHDLGSGPVEANADKNGGKEGEEWEGDGRGGDGKCIDVWRHTNPWNKNLNGAKDQKGKNTFVVGWSIGWK